jgi:eukaryotic-like serine/threonine-protein kinase
MSPDPIASNQPSTTGESWLNQIVERFEDAWQHLAHPIIEDYLPEEPGRRLKALTELIHVELEGRLKAGEAVRVESFLERYPELAGSPAWLSI